MKIRITVTKEIYRRAMMCAYGQQSLVSENCAIALAIRDIAPNARVGNPGIYWTGEDTRDRLWTPHGQNEMISRFDNSTPKERLLLPEFSFEVDFPEELVEKIGINELLEILKKSETLEKVN